MREEFSSLRQASQFDELKSAFSQTIREYGFTHFDAYAMAPGTEQEPRRPGNFYICDYGLGPVERYLANGWLGDDPTLKEAATRSAPFDYIDYLRSAPRSASACGQLALLKLFRVSSAWIIPLNEVGMVRGVTVYEQGKARPEPDLLAASLPAVQHAAGVLIDRLSELDRTVPLVRDEGRQNRLSGRETDCLEWAAVGKSNWEIGRILDISENTVRYHMKNAFRKLDTSNRAAAVSKAVSLGSINGRHRAAHPK